MLHAVAAGTPLTLTCCSLSDDTKNIDENKGWLICSGDGLLCGSMIGCRGTLSAHWYLHKHGYDLKKKKKKDLGDVPAGWNSSVDTYCFVYKIAATSPASPQSSSSSATTLTSVSKPSKLVVIKMLSMGNMLLVHGMSLDDPRKVVSIPIHVSDYTNSQVVLSDYAHLYHNLSLLFFAFDSSISSKLLAKTRFAHLCSPLSSWHVHGCFDFVAVDVSMTTKHWHNHMFQSTRTEKRWNSGSHTPASRKRADQATPSTRDSTTCTHTRTWTWSCSWGRRLWPHHLSNFSSICSSSRHQWWFLRRY